MSPLATNRKVTRPPNTVMVPWGEGKKEKTGAGAAGAESQGEKVQSEAGRYSDGNESVNLGATSGGSKEQQLEGVRLHASVRVCARVSVTIMRSASSTESEKTHTHM